MTTVVLGAFGQAVSEGLAFFLFATTSPLDAFLSVAGNTVTHGVVLGAIPFVARYPWLSGYVERGERSVIDDD